MENLNEKRMSSFFLMMAFIGCVSLLFSCSNEADNEIAEEKQEEVSTIKTRSASDLPVGKVVASVNGNKLRIAWNSVLSNCDWGQTVSLFSSYFGKYIAVSYRRYPVEMIDTEIDIDSYYIGKEWGALTVRVEACGQRIEFPLTYTGSSYFGEMIVCAHNFQPRETYIVIKGSDRGVEIETNLDRKGKMWFKAIIQYPTGLEDNTESKEFVKNINSGKQITDFSWDWNGTGGLYMGTLSFIVRIYDYNCENLSQDNCSNYIEKRISWSIADSHGIYDFSGYATIVGG